MAAATSLLAGDSAPEAALATAKSQEPAQEQQQAQAQVANNLQATGLSSSPEPADSQQEAVMAGPASPPGPLPSPPAGQPAGTMSAAPLTLDEVRGMSVEQINKNWAAVGAALKAER